MTAPDPARPAVELEECLASGGPDHILIQKGVCEKNDWQRLGSAGFVYSSTQPNTQLLYRCYSEAEHSHFASNREDCDSMGRREALLGYDLKESVVASLDRKRFGGSLARAGSDKLRPDYPGYHGPGGYRPRSTVHLAMPNARLGAVRIASPFS